MTIFCAPVMQTSWDNGKTWQDTYSPCCGPDMLLRVLAPDGTILWQGVGVIVERKCGGCDGTGVRGECEFKEVKA